MRDSRKSRPHLLTALALGSALVLATAAGCDCGDNHADNGGIADAGVDGPVDASIDAAICSTPTPGAVGGSCSEPEDCAMPNDAGVTGFCLNNAPALTEPWPVEGFCTIFCPNGDECPEGSSCSMLPFEGSTFGACMPDCCDEVGVGDACESGRLCANSLFGDEIGTESCVPGTPNVGDGAVCELFSDCDKNGVCRNDQFQFPGGQCATIRCTGPADCSPAGDGKCVDLPDEVAPICVDDCVTDADCRQSEGYRCIDRGGLVGKFCAHPAPGDACTADSDCGLPSEDWTCREGATYPGGYCTLEACTIRNNETCPIFSFCLGLVGEADTFCADKCTTVDGNECGAGYECIEYLESADPLQLRRACVPTGGTVDDPTQP